MKKIVLVLIPSFLLALAIYLVLQLVFFKSSEKGGLQVTANPKSRVFLNGKEIGQTPLCKCDPPDMLPIGNYELRIEPLSGTTGVFTQQITINSSVLTVVDRQFGSSGLAESSVISLTPLTDKNQAELLIITQPEDVDIWLDNNDIGKTPYDTKSITGNTDHTLILKKQGYKDKTVRIYSPLGYKLSATISLSVDAAGQTQTPQPSASPSATLSPTTTPEAQEKIVILQTPNGFLRVRDEASIDSAEVARVATGQTYPLLKSADGWYEISLPDGKTGWVSSDYAEVQAAH